MIALIKLIVSDFKTHGARGFLTYFVIYFTNASLRLILNYRIGYYLMNSGYSGLRVLSNFYRYRQITKRSCHISYHAKIGKRVAFPHPIGIVIGEGVVVKDDVKIWQHVTLGSTGNRHEGLSYPIIEDRVKVFTGAVVIGNICVESGATIGANSIVNKDVPKGVVVVGCPAKIVLKTVK